MQRPEASSSCSSISVNNRGESSASASARSMKSPMNNGALVSPSSFMVMPFRRFSGCYECRMVVDPVLGFTRDPSLRATICTCPQCGEIFMKAENLELHQAVRHAVSQLGAEDTSKNIVEIIFQSSWLKKQNPVCKIDRVLKVQNTPRTISKFEAYRDSVKARSSLSATSLHGQQRCLADGNELLRFHATSLLCSLGIDGSSNLCSSIPHCHVCSIIKNGFKNSRGGILTTATSGRAHDSAEVADGEREMRAMLVCRVIAGRVRKGCKKGSGDDDVAAVDEYDSVAGEAGVYSNLDELYVFSPRAILPCFVVVYRGF